MQDYILCNHACMLSLAEIHACSLSLSFCLTHIHTVTHTHTHTLKWGAHLSWMGCNSGCLEPAGYSVSLTIYCVQQASSRSLQWHSSLASIHHLSLSVAFPAHISHLALVWMCVSSLHPYFPLSLNYPIYIFSAHSAAFLCAATCVLRCNWLCKYLCFLPVFRTQPAL